MPPLVDYFVLLACINRVLSSGGARSSINVTPWRVCGLESTYCFDSFFKIISPPMMK